MTTQPSASPCRTRSVKKSTTEITGRITPTLEQIWFAQLLTAAGRPEAARAHLNTALQFAHDTEMHCYDAELLRLRAHVQHDRGNRQADVDAAIKLARR